MSSERGGKSSSAFIPTTGQSGMRLVWVMLLRIGLISILLGATIILNYTAREAFSAPSIKFLLGLIAATYFSTIVFSIWYRLGRAIELLARVQITSDLVLWGSLVYATGGIVSGFTFLFDLWLIVSAAIFGGRAAFYTATASTVILLGLAVAMYSGVLLPLSDQVSADISFKELVYLLGINIVALFIVATLITSLVSRLELTGRGLESERSRRADLAVLHADTIRSLTVGLATTGTSGEVFQMNPAGRNILGLNKEEIDGQLVSRWLPEVAKHRSRDKDVVSTGHTFGIHASGTHVPVEYTAAPLLGADGSWRGSIIEFADLTEMKHLEAALERSRRLAALGELAASLAHEIRNPLSAVSGSFQMFADRPDLSDEERSLLNIITREIRRMEQLISDMLNYARPRPLELKHTDLGRVIEEMVAAFKMGQEAKAKQIGVDVDPGLVASLDRAQLRQVLWNLMRNAAQFVDEGQTIEVRAFADGEEKVIVEVVDQGPGIPEGDREKVFDPFFSTRERGLGLGLALCKRIVESHNGTIATEPNPKGGTIFRITLPVSGSL